MKTKKVIVYVDGYNFYYGLKHGGSTWKRLYWLDVVKFFERMMLRDQELVEVNYFLPVLLMTLRLITTKTNFSKQTR